MGSTGVVAHYFIIYDVNVTNISIKTEQISYSWRAVVGAHLGVYWHVRVWMWRGHGLNRKAAMIGIRLTTAKIIIRETDVLTKLWRDGLWDDYAETHKLKHGGMIKVINRVSRICIKYSWHTFHLVLAISYYNLFNVLESSIKLKQLSIRKCLLEIVP